MLEETIRKVGNKYVVYPKKGGKRLGTHNTLSGAKKQLRAIEMSKRMGEHDNPARMADDMTLSDIAKIHGVSNQHIKDEFKMGVKVELEKMAIDSHSGDTERAAGLARDHVLIDPDYYSKMNELKEHSCVFCGSIVEVELSEDLRKWFGKGKTGGAGGGGWDRYNAQGDRVGKCGDGKEGGGYAACLSKSAARKLGKKGRASFVRRKKAAQQKAGRGRKGTGSKGKAPVRVSWKKKR